VARPGAVPLRVRPSREVFYEHSQRFTVARCCAGARARDVAFEETLAAVVAAARIDAAVLSAAVQACLVLEGSDSLCFVCSPGGALEGAWAEHAYSSLAFFASAAELCYEMLVVAGGEQLRAKLIASLDEQLCDVHVLMMMMPFIIKAAGTSCRTGASKHTVSCATCATTQHSSAPPTRCWRSAQRPPPPSARASTTDERQQT
jgi:hypothetical protein